MSLWVVLAEVREDSDYFNAPPNLRGPARELRTALAPSSGLDQPTPPRSHVSAARPPGSFGKRRATSERALHEALAVVGSNFDAAI